MERFDQIWRRVRDVLMTVVAVFLLVLLGLGKVPQAIAPLLLGVAGALAGAPVFLRKDKRDD